jgi:hypothetical protein
MTHLDLSFDEIEEALNFLDPNLPLKEWSKIGRSLASEHGNNIRDIFEHWSSKGSSYHEKEFDKHWRNFINKTKSTSFGSFIYEITQAGWSPKKQTLSEEDKQTRKAEWLKRKAEADLHREKVIKQQWDNLKEEQALFNSWPINFSPTGYMREKQMTELTKYIDARLGRDKFNNACLCWPIYSELFNKGDFCGFERILDKKVKVGNRVLNKFASDNTKTDAGFVTFGKEWVHGRKRVFVVGGLADAYSAHVTSGEVIVTPIGEDNIPDIVKKIRTQYPDAEIITAPDNDNKGRLVIDRAGGMWTLPQSEGKDWSDVYLTEGKDALLSQLFNVRGFEVVTSNTRYLSASIRSGLNMLRSGMGSGKTTVVRGFIEDNITKKILIVSHRRALAKSIESGISSKDVKVQYYEDLVIKNAQGIDANLPLREAQILVCSVDSLWRLAGSHWDVVFVDEVEQNLFQYYAKTIAHGEHCLNFLSFALTHSEVQILADAHLGDLTKNFCNYIGLQSGVLYHNEYQIGQGKKLYIYESKAHLTEVMMQKFMDNNKAYVFANSKEDVKKMAQAVEIERERGNYNGKVLVVHADVANEKGVAEALKDINAIVPELDVIIASPTLGTGFDIKSESHLFKQTIGFLTSRVGTSEEGHQGLNRARDIKEFHVYVDPAERSEPENADYIRNKLIEEVSAETMRLLTIDPDTGEYARKNALYEWLYGEVKAKANLSQNSYKTRFLELAKADGYNIIEVAKNDLAAKLGCEIREQAKERTDRELLRDVTNATVHTGQAFDYMMNNGEDFTPTEISKSKVAHDLNLEDASEDEMDALYPLAKEVYDKFKEDGENIKFNETDAAMVFPQSINNAVASALTYKQTKNRFVNNLKNLAWINVTPNTAKALDLKDVEHAESRVSWRHISIRRSHMIKFLQAAGIDEDLNYNGKQWTAEDLNKIIGPWLRQKRTQDNLFKYSGVTVTANALENPCQWFNNRLKSYAIPLQANKKRDRNGKAINVYSVDFEAFDGIKALVAMRTRGIEEALTENGDAINVEALTNSVTSFIDKIEAGDIKAGYSVLFSKLNKRCALAGQAELGDKLTHAFAKIAHLFDDKHIEKTDPPLPVVISKQIGQGGSNKIAIDPYESTMVSNIEGEERLKEPQRFHHLSQTLTPEHLAFIETVADIAINKYKLEPGAVIDVMIHEGIEVFKGDIAAWASTVRDIINWDDIGEFV